MASANLFQQYLRPPRSVSEYTADLDKGEVNKLALLGAQMEMRQKQEGLREQNALRALVAQGLDIGTPEGLMAARRAAPNVAGRIIKEHFDLEKLRAETGKTAAETDRAKAQTGEVRQKTVNEGLRRYYDMVGRLTPETAPAFVEVFKADPANAQIVAAMGPAANAPIPTDPQGFAQWRATTALGLEKLSQMSKINTVDAGNERITQAVQPATGEVSTLSRAPVRVSPGQVVQAQTQMRGQDMQLQGQQARAIASTSGTGRPPPGYRATPEGNLEAIPGGPADQKISGQFNQDTAALSGSSAQLDRLAEAANKLLKSPGLERIYGLQGKLPNVPGMAGADAAAQLETLKSQIGFSVLQAMRDASKTGGALGAVTEKELGFLQNNLAALDRAQSVRQAKESLEAIIKFTEQSKDRLRDAYNLRHGGKTGEEKTVTFEGRQVKARRSPRDGKYYVQKGTEYFLVQE